MDSIKWTRKTGGGFSMYSARVGRRWYRIVPAPGAGWIIESAAAGEFWQSDGYVRTVADGKAWVQEQAEAVTA